MRFLDLAQFGGEVTLNRGSRRRRRRRCRERRGRIWPREHKLTGRCLKAPSARENKAEQRQKKANRTQAAARNRDHERAEAGQKAADEVLGGVERHVAARPGVVDAVIILAARIAVAVRIFLCAVFDFQLFAGFAQVGSGWVAQLRRRVGNQQRRAHHPEYDPRAAHQNQENTQHHHESAHAVISFALFIRGSIVFFGAAC